MSKSLPTRIAVFVVVAAVVFIAWSAIPPATTFDDDDAMPTIDNDLVARGEYLATAGNCATCHTAPGGDVMAGGLPFVTPFGTIYSTNITPDSETGIGGWSFADFANSMRHGVRPDGTNLYPAFPYTSFTKVTDDDLAAIYAYLMSVEAVSQPARDNELSFPFNQRALMKAWKTLFFDEGAFVADDARSDDWNRGAYLVEALAHCGACHTPRNAFGAEQADRAYAGGEYLDRVLTGEYRPWSAPNLTSADRGLGIWSHEDLASYLKTARNDFLESFGPMNEVIMNSTRHLSDGDIDAMATYLKSLPAIPEAAGPLPDERTMGRGRTIYNLHCGTCHLPTGEGDPEMAPRVNRGSLVVQSDNPASMINAILYSPEAPHPPWRPSCACPGTMPPVP